MLGYAVLMGLRFNWLVAALYALQVSLYYLYYVIIISDSCFQFRDRVERLKVHERLFGNFLKTLE